MKKWICFILSCCLIACFAGVSAAAETAAATVRVTLSDQSGKVVLAQEPITVTDRNEDGKLDIDEALFAAHEAKFEGGAAAGYATSTTEWGLGITKLLGDESGSYGYYVNHKSAWNLSDEVKDGDLIDAFVYQDSKAWSDVYAYFDQDTASITEGDEITLVLKDSEYDAAAQSMAEVPVSGAVITINGEETAYKTDAEGKVTFPLNQVGEVLISAKSADKILVPPVFKATVSAKPAPAPVTEEEPKPAETKSPKTGDHGTLIVLFALCAVAAVFAGKKWHEA